ncbi:hypothetical protein [Nocardiopsis suaedae]|uniref:Uncharacterized protein n=1 Tax=Nocardiopsis suaedae TaxID=3018444 RepID=A0ABT4TNM8_9ACTN|nr:hypothetical protein [Nocardiopsis suaedae]MDA2805722.1 hypothetical protein [Nocardiopsis suaedae]
MANRYRYLRPSRPRACRTKRRFPTQQAAAARLAEIAAAPRTRVIPHRAYPCEWCSGWHLSSKEAA